MPLTIRFLAKAIAVLTVILIAEWFGLFGVAHLQEIQADPQSIPRPSVQFNYVEPVEMLKSAGTELSYRSKLDIEDNGISLNEAEVWRSNTGNRLIAGLHFQGKDASSSNSRLVVVLRDKKGSPWYIGDAPLYDPATPSASLSNEIWVILEFDEKTFSQDARFNAEWFDRVANSTIDIGVALDHQIVVAGEGYAASSHELPLTPLYTLTSVGLFQH